MKQSLSTQGKVPARRREATDQRRREILNAALELFLRQGINATTMPEICSASGASTGSVYHQFEGKDEIAMTLYEEGMRGYEDEMLQATKKKMSLRRFIHALIATHLQHVVKNPPLSLYLARLNLADGQGEMSQKYRDLNNHFSQTLWSRLKPYAENGELVQLPQEFYFSQIIGPAAHLARGWLSGRIEGDLLSATDHLAEAAWKSLAKQHRN